MREGDPHAIPPIRLGLHAQHHAPHRHARCRCPSERAGREADDGAQLRAWLEALPQPHVETASADVITCGGAREGLPTCVYTARAGKGSERRGCRRRSTPLEISMSSLHP